MNEYKRCSRCKATKDVSEFYKNRSTSDGLTNYCQVCMKQLKIEWQTANPEKQTQVNKRSKAKRKVQDKANKIIWIDKNRDKVNAQKRAWNAANKESVRATYLKQYEKNPQLFKDNANKYRARVANAQTFYIRPKEIKAMYLKPCIYCGSTGKVEIDHVIPLNRGGVHGIGNLAPACLNCNRSRQDYFVMEWRLKRKTPQ